MNKRYIENILNNIYSIKKGKLKPRIIYFHSIAPNQQRSHAPEQFEGYLKILKRLNVNTLTISEFIGKIASRSLVANDIAITFDDGYKDNYEWAFPLLEKYKFTATIYVVAGIYNSKWQIDLKNINRLYPSREMLNEDNLIFLANRGVEIGSHSLTHNLLTKQFVKDQGIVYSELKHSKQILEDIIGLEVKAFSYPNGQKGAISAQITKIAFDLGYTSVVSTIWGHVSNKYDLQILPRCEVSSRDDLDTFLNKIIGKQDYRSILHMVKDGSKNWE